MVWLERGIRGGHSKKASVQVIQPTNERPLTSRKKQPDSILRKDNRTSEMIETDLNVAEAISPTKNRQCASEESARETP